MGCGHAIKPWPVQELSIGPVVSCAVHVGQSALNCLARVRIQILAFIQRCACMLQQVVQAELRFQLSLRRHAQQRVLHEAQGLVGLERLHLRLAALLLGDTRLCACLACLPERDAGAGEQRNGNHRQRCGQCPVAPQPQPHALACREPGCADRPVIKPGPEVAGQRVGGGVARFRIALQAGLHDARQVAAQRLCQRCRRVAATPCGLFRA